MLKGPDALRSLDEAIKDIRREEDDITRRLARASERIAKTRETELDLFRELAQVRLEPEAQAELTARLSQAEQQAREMLRRHTAEMEAAARRLAELDARVAQLATDRAAALSEIEANQNALDALSAQIEARLATDAAYAAQSREAEDLANMARAAAQKTERAEADRDEKGAPYRADPIFVYLWERRFGTSAYKANPVIAALDARVARLIGFADARPNYAMLTAIPERLGAHARRLAEDAQAAVQAVEALEIAAVDAAGGKPMRLALAALAEKVAEIDAQLLAAEDERDTLTQTQQQLAQGGDPTFEEAVGMLARTMASRDVSTLLSEARQTRTPRDDAIVAKIEDARLRIEEEEAESREHTARLRTLEARRRELEDIEFEFKRERFDDPRSTFGEDKLVGDLLDEFLKGAITASTYWGHWRRSQSWRGGAPRSGPASTRGRAGGGFSLPPGGFGPRPPSGGSWGDWAGGNASKGGGFSRPRTGSAGRRKSGGFKTGGGF